MPRGRGTLPLSAAVASFALLMVQGCQVECESYLECGGLGAAETRLCIAGQCVRCTHTAQCQQVIGRNYSCELGACVECEPGTDGCGCGDGELCREGLECLDGICQPSCLGSGDEDACACGAGDSCAPGLTCMDGVICVGCSPGARECPCDEDRGCAEGLYCVDDRCVPQGCNPGDPGCACLPAGGCVATSFSCIDGICRDCSDGGIGCACNGPSDCAPGEICDVASSTVAASCRAPLRCADLVCPHDHQVCVGVVGADAQCRCDTGYVQDPTTGGCRQLERCPPCGQWNRPGETGAFLMTADGQCICETEPGYYFSMSGDPRARPCDEDQDGWVRLDAYPYIEGQGTAQSPVLREQARCTVTVIRRLTLHDERGGAATATLSAPIAMYETLRTDALAAVDDLPPFPRGGHLSAADVNPLTKACVQPGADFNGNGIPDLDESNETELEITSAPFAALSNGGESLFAQLLRLQRLTHFVELHRHWVSSETLHIAERPRVASDGSALSMPRPPTRPQGSSNAWLTCTRYNDAAFGDITAPGGRVGFDLAALNYGTRDQPALAGAGFAGMLHHSQFKCVGVLPLDDPRASLRQYVTTNTLSDLGAQAALGICRYDGPTSGTVNPFDCTHEVTTATTTGGAAWAVLGFGEYEGGDGYRRGCRNRCESSPSYVPPPIADAPASCAAQAPTPNFRTTCAPKPEEYGAASCGSVWCPPHRLLLEPNSPSGAPGFWLCGTAGQSAAELNEHPGPPQAGFSIQGRTTTIPRAVLGDPNGFRIVSGGE